ncbi:hypothetical protein QG37_04220 [Candidozyma auris]|nr:hypothetical protein QG37_04220 [[Candida] auris]
MQYHAITQSVPSLFSRSNWDQMPAQASASGRMRKTKKIQPPEAFFFFFFSTPILPSGVASCGSYAWLDCCWQSVSAVFYQLSQPVASMVE